MTTLLMTVWLAIAAGAQMTPSQIAWLKDLEGTWVIDNARGADADIEVTISRDPKGVLLLKAVFPGYETVTRYDPSGKDTANGSPGAKVQSTFRSRVENRTLVTEIWDGKADGPPQRIETRFMQSRDVMVTELRKTPGGSVFNSVALRRKPR